MKVVVTGAAGMLGRAVVAAVEAGGHAVLGLSRREADVTHLDSLRHPLHAFRPDWLIHCAAFTRVDECESHADQAYLVNVLGSRHVAQAALDADAAVLAVSSDYVFDGSGTVPYREYDAADPRSVYGLTKLGGEQAVREICPRHVIVRTSWLYGRGGANFVDTILRKARAGEALRVVDDQRGSPTWVKDLAAGLVRLAESGAFGTYHCTNSGDCTWHDLAVHAIERAGLQARVERTDTASFPRPARRPAYSVLSNLLYEHVTGHRMAPWQDAVSRYLAGAAGAGAANSGSASDKEDR